MGQLYVQVKVFHYLTWLKSCYIEHNVAQIYLCITYPEISGPQDFRYRVIAASQEGRVDSIAFRYLFVTDPSLSV